MRSLVVLAFCFIYSLACSQKTEWMFNYNQNATAYSKVHVINDGNIVIANNTIPYDNATSFYFKNKKIESSLDAQNLIVTKLTPSDSLIWIFTTNLINGSFVVTDVKSDANANIYVLGYSSDSLAISDDTLQVIGKHKFTQAKLLKLNKRGKPIWIRSFGSITNQKKHSLHLGNSRLDIDNGKIFIAHYISGTFKYDGLADTFPTTASMSALVSYDTLGNFKFVKQYGPTVYGSVPNIKCQNNFSFFNINLSQDLLFKNGTIPKGDNIIKVDSTGGLVSFLHINRAFTIDTWPLAFDIYGNSSMYLVASFYDSMEILNERMYARGKTGTWGEHYSSCVLKIKSLSSVEWCKCLKDSSGGYLTQFAGMDVRNDNIYFSSVMAGNNLIFGLDTVSIKNSLRTLFFAKMDTLSNSLWNFPTGSPKSLHFLNNQAIDLRGDIYLTGNFSSKLKIFDDSLENNNVSETFLAKILDYEITRGEVNPGPYCAGDFLKIPYTQVGVYDTANYFIAELSDEKGNFEGDEREMGRVKTTEDSTILGELPMFQVASSGNYRIRVRSTHPPVQSYYQFDSLRLLIYSRDKANPGPPELVCTGDSFQLNTFGGTAWQWSPAHHMNDSSLRQPMVLADTNITYSIIISDSSGCGEADTAFKELVVRKAPEILLNKKDSTVCMTSTTAIVAGFSFGDTAAYHWQWLEIDTGGLTKLLALDSNLNVVPKLFDTLYYSLSPQETDSQQLMLVLTDDCSKNTDTAYFTLYIQQQKEKISAGFLDTAICPQTEVLLTADFTLGNNTYSWSWWHENKLLERDTGKSSDSITVNPVFGSMDTLIYSLVLKDQCSPRQDTAFFTLTPKESLKILTRFTDTTVCKGQTFRLQATASGGVPNHYQWSWTDAQGKELSADYDLKVTADSQMQIKLKLEDGCMPMGDSLSFILNITPPLKAAILTDNSTAKDTTLCFGNALNLKAQSTGGKGADYDYWWFLDGDLISEDSILHYTFSEKSDTQHTFQLVVSDNCTPQQDTTELKVTVRSQLKVDASLPDTLCRGDEVQLTAFPSGGLQKDYTFQWIWHNQTISTDSSTLRVLDNPKEGVDTLLLVLSDGCTKPQDTLINPLFFRPPLNLAITTTDRCATDSLVLTAQTSGGLTNGHQLKWWDENNQTLGTQTMLTVTPNPVNTYRAVLTDGCTTTPDTASINVGKTPTLNVLTIPNQGCEPLEVTFKLSTEYKGQYQWVFEDGKGTQTTFTPEDSIVVIDYPRGSYTPTLELTTDFGCVVNWQSTGLTAFPKPIADFTYQPEKPSLDSPEVHFINLSVDADSFVWDLGGYGKSTEEQPIVLYEAEGKYTIQLIAKNIYQCSDTARGFLTVKPGYFIYLPNAFSPNGDGLNDRFSPVASGIDIIEFEIYNRWGECMFKGNQGDSWDGTYLGKPVPQGVYVCVLPVAAKDQNDERVRGSFLLIR